MLIDVQLNGLGVIVDSCPMPASTIIGLAMKGCFRFSLVSIITFSYPILTQCSLFSPVHNCRVVGRECLFCRLYSCGTGLWIWEKWPFLWSEVGHGARRLLYLQRIVRVYQGEYDLWLRVLWKYVPLARTQEQPWLPQLDPGVVLVFEVLRWSLSSKFSDLEKTGSNLCVRSWSRTFRLNLQHFVSCSWYLGSVQSACRLGTLMLNAYYLHLSIWHVHALGDGNFLQDQRTLVLLRVEVLLLWTNVACFSGFRDRRGVRDFLR